jgi:Protein of unknown function (DUF2934)
MPQARMPRNGSSIRKVRAAKTKTDQGPAAGNGSTAVSLEDEIRARAYELYQQRGYAPGDEHQDWLAAERQIRARHNQQPV